MPPDAIPDPAHEGSVHHLVDVGGYQLHLSEKGTGRPTVVLESGLGDSSAPWSTVFDAVAAFTRVVAYDRAGLGRSDRAVTPRTCADLVADLHTLLRRAAVPSPYVLVGHSFGGFTVRV
jgi:pimeloyl-ACP methyl ester carboxylesterase